MLRKYENLSINTYLNLDLYETYDILVTAFNLREYSDKQSKRLYGYRMIFVQ